MPLRVNRRWVWLVVAVAAASVGVVGYQQVRHHYMSIRSRTPTMDRLHQIGLAILLYNQDHHGAYPDSLRQLADSEGLSPDWPLCPDDDGNTDPRMVYVYLGHGLTADTAGFDPVLAHEPLAFFDGRGCNMLFGDGHVDWVTAADLPAVLARGGPATRPTTRPRAGI